MSDSRLWRAFPSRPQVDDRLVCQFSFTKKRVFFPFIQLADRMENGLLRRIRTALSPPSAPFDFAERAFPRPCSTAFSDLKVVFCTAIAVLFHAESTAPTRRKSFREADVVV